MASESSDKSGGRTLKTATTTLKIIGVLKDLNGATLTEVAEELEAPKSSVYNHLMNLYENEFVVKDGARYELSPRFIQIGEHVRQENPLYQFGKEQLDELIDETGEYGQLVTEEHGKAIVVYLARGERAIGTDYPNHMKKKSLYLHHTAAGKAILAHLPEERVAEIIDQHSLFKRTDNTITTEEELYEELERVRERGYATNQEEEVKGLNAIGAPIFGPEGGILGALSLSGPKSRMSGERFTEELPQMVRNVADVIEVDINMSSKIHEF